MYEVLKFIEHGTHCRQSMDCIRGTLLIRYMKEHPVIEKAGIFSWFRQLCVCVDQYHRCRNRKEYRYLNPYSVVVSEEGELLLLDLEAPENAFVMKQMQKHTVRNHFVKPVFEMGAGREQRADLFAYGKTIQFLLAYTEVVPALTRREEARLSRIISRCMGESGREYTDISRVLKDLPVMKEKDTRPADRRRKKLFAAAAVCTALYALLTVVRNEEITGWKPAASEGVTAEIGDLGGEAVREAAARPEMSEEEILEAAENFLEKYVSGGSRKDIRSALELGREIELNTVRRMAELYESQDMSVEAAAAYGRLIQIEKEDEKIEAAGIGKMEAEARAGNYTQAVETGELVLEKVKDSKQISRLIEEYKAQSDIQDETAAYGTEENELPEPAEAEDNETEAGTQVPAGNRAPRDEGGTADPD